MRPRFYFLNDDKTYKPCSLNEWANQMEVLDKHVGDEIVNGYRVSTVWLGLDHNCHDGAPHLFETMVFGDHGNDYNELFMKRYNTWDDAKKGHDIVVSLIRQNKKIEELKNHE